MSVLRALAVVCLWVLLATSGANAQNVGGSLQGRVLGPEGNPLGMAEVTITGRSLQGEQTSTPDDQGNFRLLALPVGLYTVRIRAIGFRPIRFDDIPVRLGRTTPLGDIRLEGQAFDLPELVVSVPRPLVDPMSTAIGANLTRESYENIPVDRSYESLVTLVPGASASFLGDALSIQGGTGLENNYFIDGVNVADPFGHRVSGTRLPWNFVKEVEVRTGGYEAEHRSSLGGIVNVVTHSGGNELSGEVFGFGVYNRFAGETRFGVAEPRSRDFAQFDAGVSIGGAVMRDRLWFFGAYNIERQREEVLLPGLDFYGDRSTTHSFAGKLTFKATDRTTLTATVFGDPSSREAVGQNFTSNGTPAGFANPDPFLGRLRTGSVAASIQGSHRLGGALLLEASASRMRIIEVNGPLTNRGAAEPLFIDQATGVWSGGYPDSVDLPSTRTAFTLSTTLQAGRHTIKIGGEYIRNRLKQNFNGEAVYRTSDTTYRRIMWDASGTVYNRLPSIYAQDSWLVTPRLRINAGLRWDGQYLIDSEARTALRITDQFQPRLGLIFHPGGVARSQKLFASFGRFYQELATQLSSVFHDYTSTGIFTDYNHDPRLDPSGGDTILAIIAAPVPAPDVKGQYYDEWVLGYEQQLGDDIKAGVRGIFRTLGQGIEDGFDSIAGRQSIGNPGRGGFSPYPRMRRDFAAVELVIEKTIGRRFGLLGSYVWSRNYGNYPGLYNTDLNLAFANLSSALSDFPGIDQNTTGLLPNDRPHVLKLSGAYRVTPSFVSGASFLWQSGTPLNELGATIYGFPWLAFLRERGSAGRTPAIWDLNFRFSYDFSSTTGLRPKLLLDVFHVASQRKPVNLDQIRFACLDASGSQACPNPTYLQPTRYQPPMSARLGLLMGF